MQMRVSTTSHRLMVVHCFVQQFVPVDPNLFFQRVKLSGPGLCVGCCNAGDCF